MVLFLFFYIFNSILYFKQNNYNMLIKEEIGTVEPIGYYKDGELSETIAFIRGAIEKYAKHEEYHESILNYIKKIIQYNENCN